MINRHSIILLLATAFIAPVTDAMAQTNSRTVITNDLNGQYEVIKALINPSDGTFDYEARSEGTNYNLHSCGDMETDLGLDPEGDFATDSLTRIAGYYHMWTNHLPKIGYPSEAVETSVREVEKKLLASVINNNEHQLDYEYLILQMNSLATELNTIRSNRKLQAPPLEVMDECGGGRIQVNFKTPTGVKMFMLPSFFARLCEKQGIDPYDRSACNQYWEIIDGMEAQLSGVYTYIAEWPDGTVKTGQFDAWSLPEQGQIKFFKLSP